MERREIYYSGRVQGVGFRYTTLQIASRFNVTGFVENLPDGRVHLVAEGRSDELDQFTRVLGERLKLYISATQETHGPAAGNFAGFTIRG